MLDTDRQMEQQAKKIEMVAQYVADHLSVECPESNQRYISSDSSPARPPPWWSPSRA